MVQSNWRATTLVLCVVIGACGPTGHTEDIEGRWALISTDLDTSDGSLVAATDAPTKFIVIGPDHISGILGCGDLDAAYEYSPPLLRLTERFEYTGGNDEDSPCDVEMWNGILDSKQSVTFPEDGVMVWTSGDTQLVFEASD